MQKLETLFHAALEKPLRERVDWAHEQCADDPALLRELLALLAADLDTHTAISLVEQELAGYLHTLPEPGTTIDHYVLKRKIADGGMGTVFEATDVHLGRAAAIKFLHPHRALSSRAKKRFLDEARAISRLNHPNVCTIYGISEYQRDGDRSGEQYIAMEFCDGAPLDEAVATNSLTYAQITDILHQLSSALIALHSADIVHRDLKPANIILSPGNHVKLLDFGLAGVANAQDSGEPMGTIAFMAPEQFTSGTIDHRTDIWAFGVICHLLFTGQRPFDGNSTAEIMHAIMNVRNPGQTLPTPLKNLITGCLHPDPEQRVATATDLLALVNQTQVLYAGREGSEKPIYQGETARQPTATTSHLARRTVTTVAMKLNFEPALDIEDRALIAAQVSELFASVSRQFAAFLPNEKDVAVLGFPVAQEHSASLAVRCAIAIKEAVVRRRDRFPDAGFRVGVGVHTGTMVVKQDDDESTLIGDVIDDARHIAGLGHDQVMLTDATAELVGEHFTLGDPHPSGAKSALFEAHPTDRFVDDEFLSPFVGRTHELGMLTDAWEDVIEGRGRVIAVSAEPGLGKSRVVHELKRHINDNHDVWFVNCLCSPYESNTALYPVTRYFTTEFMAIDADLSDVERFERIDGFRDEYGLPKEDLNLLLRLFNVDDPNARAMTEGDRIKMRACLVRLLRLRSALQPLLVVFEDLHWADPTTNDFLNFLLSGPALPNILVVLTFRPQYQCEWLQQTHVTQIVLNALNGRDSKNLAQYITNNELTEDQTRQLIDHADGNPLYIEELAKTPVGKRIPVTLQDSLMSRLDGEGDAARLMAQLASVIGREFPEQLICALSPHEDEITQRLLAQLVRANIVHSDNVSANDPGKSRYRFKHALVRDAAYATLVKADRELHHQAIAEHLAMDKQTDPGVLAYHLMMGHHHWDAALASFEAARRALASYAPSEALEHCQHVLVSLARCTAKQPISKLELDTYQLMGPALMATKGYADPTVEDAFRRALALCEQLNDHASAFPMSFGLWTYHCVSAHHDAAAQQADALVHMANAQGVSDLIVEAHMVRGITHFFQGDFAAADRDLATALANHDKLAHANHAMVFGQDPLMVILAYQGWLAWYTNHRQSAIDLVDAAVTRARETKHPFTLAYALTFAAWLHVNQGNADVFSALLREAATVTEQHHIELFAGLTDVIMARAELLCNPTDRGIIEDMLTAMDTYGMASARLFTPTWHTEIAQAYLDLDDIDNASEHLELAKRQADAGGEGWTTALWWFVLARLHAVKGDDHGAAQARAHYHDVTPFLHASLTQAHFTDQQNE